MKENNSKQFLRGSERERTLDRSAYFSDGYFSLHQLCSFSHQINDIYQFRPKTMLEVGMGGGFTSSYLARSGINVTTADINCNLKPDICASISELSEKIAGQQYDLVVCCEVLEHMPYADFENSIKTLRSFSNNLYLTLPNYKRVYGFGGFLRIPKIGAKLTELMFELPGRKLLEKEHFWELGSSKETTRENIRKILLKYYANVSTRRYSLNPYHVSFMASPH